MSNDTTYREKFAILNPWLPQIISSVRKDLRKDHLKQDHQFLKQYLQGKPINKLTNEDLVSGYSQALQNEERAEAIGEFITNRWLLKRSDLYYHFEKHLLQISPDITQITSIDDSQGKVMVDAAVEEFGAVDTYLFCQLNSVSLSNGLFKALEKRAEEEVKTEEKQEHFDSIDAVKQKYEQQIARLQDRYEKKLSSLERKYHQDVETLKKQIGNLQKKVTV